MSAGDPNFAVTVQDNVAELFLDLGSIEVGYHAMLLRLQRIVDVLIVNVYHTNQLSAIHSN